MHERRSSGCRRAAHGGWRGLLYACALLALLALPEARPSQAGAAGQGVGSVLTYGSTQEPDTLNPLLTQTAAGQAIDSLVFEGLLRVDNQNRLQAGLAVAWQRTADGRTWTFHLRRGVRFADGVDLTSTDVYWTYLSIRNPNNHVASVQGWDEVDSMRTPDRFTVVMHLRRWLAPWLFEVGTTAILPKHALYLNPTINDSPFNRTPFGTGPYTVSEWRTGNHITLSANPHYWGAAPHLRTIGYLIEPDDAHLLAALRTGRVGVGMVNARQVDQARRIAHARIVETPSMTWYHVDLKQWGYLREQAVRQALDYATPREALVREILDGHAQIAHADIAPALADYYDPAVPQHRYSPLRAAEILAADGFRPGTNGILQRCLTGRRGCAPLRITLWSIAGDYFSRDVNARLVREWRAIGIDVSARLAPLSQALGPAGPQFSREATGLTYGWTNADEPDDRYYWNSAYVPASPTAAGGNNVAYFYRFQFQSQIDALTDAGVVQTDPAKRRVVYDRIQRLLADQVPAIFLYWPTTILVVPERLQGVQPSPFSPPLAGAPQWR